jgi:serine/threonine protein kinase
MTDCVARKKRRAVATGHSLGAECRCYFDVPKGVAVTSVAVGAANGPQLVGRYVLYGAIASGGMATVHFGRLVGAAGFTRPVAIKRLHAQFARDPDFVRMFLDEARLAARITHPNVVQTLDLVEETDEVFLVMDYVRGQTLASLSRTLRRKGARIPAPLAVGIIVGVLEGLHAAHEATDDMGERLELIHRDVSPQNILVGTDGVARLLDFGVAKAAGRSQSTRDGLLKGKVGYMAPEQAQGLPLTRRTDLFAASVVLWEMLTGRRLFHGDNDIDSLRRVLAQDLVPPGSIVGLPQALDRVVMKGLDRDPSKRYATAHELAVDVAACITPATPAEIGGWVERTAAEELEERASRIAAIERSAAGSVSQLRRVDSISGMGAGSSAAPRRPSLRWLLAAIGGAVLVVAAALFAVGRSPQHVASPLVPAPSAASSVAAPAPAESVIVTASSAEAAPVAPPSSRAFPAAARWPTLTTMPGGPPRAGKPAATSSSSPAAARPGCDPPYTEDGQGHIHFKPSCL